MHLQVHTFFIASFRIHNKILQGGLTILYFLFNFENFNFLRIASIWYYSSMFHFNFKHLTLNYLIPPSDYVPLDIHTLPFVIASETQGGIRAQRGVTTTSHHMHISSKIQVADQERSIGSLSTSTQRDQDISETSDHGGGEGSGYQDAPEGR